MKLPKAGTMRPLKKVIGVILGIYGIELLIKLIFKKPCITEFIESSIGFGISWVYIIAILIGAYLLIITGRQR